MARWKKILEDNNNTIPAPNPVLKADKVEITRTVSFITPMFGGGVKTENHPYDDITPVRVSSIRGQLRFWWRAAVGSGLESIKEMKEKEVELFGGSYKTPDNNGQQKLKRSTVEITIKKQPCVQEEVNNPYAMEYRNPNTAIGYACFPLRNDGGKLQKIAASFNIKIQCNKTDEKDVELALECWLAFGGLGGRTRRGFGALKGGQWTLDGILKKIPNVPPEHLRKVPSLMGATCLKVEQNTIIEAHKDGLDALKNFRKNYVKYKRKNIRGFPSRLASPLIIRPYEENGKFYSMVLGLACSIDGNANSLLQESLAEFITFFAN